MRVTMLIWLLSIGKSYACSCGGRSIDHDVDRAFDIIVGKIIAEKEQCLSCIAKFGNHSYEEYNSYSYSVMIDHSYKGKLSNIAEIHGGKGLGDCGAILTKGYSYLIVVFKCDKGYYTYLCADNDYLPNAGWQLKFLNDYFNINYHPVKATWVMATAVLCLMVAMGAILITFRKFKHRSRRFYTLYSGRSSFLRISSVCSPR